MASMKDGEKENGECVVMKGITKLSSVSSRGRTENLACEPNVTNENFNIFVIITDNNCHS